MIPCSVHSRKAVQSSKYSAKEVIKRLLLRLLPCSANQGRADAGNCRGHHQLDEFTQPGEQPLLCLKLKANPKANSSFRGGAASGGCSSSSESAGDNFFGGLGAPSACPSDSDPCSWGRQILSPRSTISRARCYNALLSDFCCAAGSFRASQRRFYWPRVFPVSRLCIWAQASAAQQQISVTEEW